jgi:hypothetical protein
MATEWIAADEDTLIRLAYMLDAEARGQANATLRGEIRHLEDRFGLSPMARRKLGWEVGPEGGADVRRLPSRRRVQAIDPNPDPREGLRTT